MVLMNNSYRGHTTVVGTKKEVVVACSGITSVYSVKIRFISVAIYSHIV